MKIQATIQNLLNNKQSKTYLVVFLFCGILLMLLPTPSKTEKDVASDGECRYSLEHEEERLEKILSSINGVQDCKVLLSVSASTETILAEDEGTPLVVSNGNQEETVTVLERYPKYQGAVIVMGGYSDANVRFDVLSAVMSYTGLENDKITICPIEE